MLTAAVILIALILAIYFYKKYVNKYSDINNLPGPSYFKLLKHLYCNDSSDCFVANLLKLNNIYGTTVKLLMNPLKPAIITSDMEFCNKIFKSKDLHVTPCLKQVKLLRNAFFISSQDGKWHFYKQLIMKHLTKEYIAKRLFIYGKKYDNLLGMIRSTPGKPFDMQGTLAKLFLEVMLNTLNDPNIDLTEEEINTYLNNKTNLNNLLTEKINSFRMIGFLHKFTENHKLQSKLVRETLTFVEDWVKRFKNVDKQMREEDNLVYPLIDSGISDVDIVDFLNGLIHGGHDTAVFPICMFFREVAECSKLQQNILNEIWSTIGTDINTPVTLADVDKMLYLQAAMKESFRRYTSLPFLDRELTYDMTVGNVKIPEGTTVIFNFPEILTSDKNYDDPLSFKPERFLKENVTPKSIKAFIGFGYGVKICPAKDLSYAALKLLVVKLLREFEISPTTPTHKIKLTSNTIFHSANGIPVVFQKRILNK